jgi:hypothetical protein
MKNPLLKSERPYRVLRGGGMRSFARLARVSRRDVDVLMLTYDYLGFRLFRTVEKK